MTLTPLTRVGFWQPLEAQKLGVAQVLQRVPLQLIWQVPLDWTTLNPFWQVPQTLLAEQLTQLGMLQRKH